MKSTSSGQRNRSNSVFDVSDLDLEDVPHRLGLIKATWTGVRVLPREVRTNTLLRAGNHP